MPSPTEWLVPPGFPALDTEQVHLWRSGLDFDAISISRFHEDLSEDEADRSARFKFDRDRNHFIAARGILRELLGMYLELPPRAVRFEYGTRKKPRLHSEFQTTDLRFNVSHSGGIAVFAFALGREIGVDVELVRPSFANREVAERYFSPSEVAEWRALSTENQTEGFFLCWTRKEAYVKARGEGLYIPLNEFDVSLTPGEPVTLRSSDGDRWKLSSFDPGHQCAGAMVVEGKDWECLQWERMNKRS
jgi:4'-phosphopantetheinyl transferase